MTRTALAITTSVLAMGVAMAQSPKAILTGGDKGAYHTLFCPPIPPALAKAYFQGYTCVPSAGTNANIDKCLETPSRICFVQSDVFAQRIAADASLATRLTVVRSDLACEGLWMVTKNDRLQSYGDVLAFARRITFVLPPKASGANASFEFLQSIDPQGLGRATNVKYLGNATEMLRAVAASPDGAVGFFVQFADPENPNIKLMSELGLRAIPVISRELIRTKVDGKDLYQVQSFDLTAGGIFTKANSVTTACTPVALITGSPDSLPDANAKDDQRDLIARLREIPAADLLPAEPRIASLIKSAKRLGTAAAQEAVAAVELARKKAEEAMK